MRAGSGYGREAGTHMTEDEVAVTLPAASPSSYLLWTAYWRQVEQAMARRPDLERVASAASAPFLHGEVARFISEHLVRSLAYQAIEALRLSEYEEFSPVLRWARSLLAATPEYVERRARYLQDDADHAALGIDRLDTDLVSLRARAIAAIREQLAG
jgi:hypothetical protein